MAAAQNSRERDSNDDLRRALGFKPIQQNVEYDVPSPDEIENCRLESARSIGKTGFLVYHGSGRLLRAYLDNNSDGRPDQWSYFRNGIEVYRDIDSNFDEKADQYRWLGTAGIRWGIDQNQDGKIDYWKQISAEELSMEMVEAVKTRDASRFDRLLISGDQLSSLNLDDEQENQIAERAREARESFARFAASQRIVDGDTRWVHFGGTKPGMIAAGAFGSNDDIMIYDNVQAVVENGNSHGQLALGTLVNTAQGWRATDLPQVMEEGVAISNGNLFYQGAGTLAASVTGSSGSVDSPSQKLFEEYMELEEKLASAGGSELATLHEQRAQLVIEMAKEADSDTEKSNWLRQMVDDVAGAYQTGEFPRGLEFLDAFITSLKQQNGDEQQIAYASYRRLTSYYTKQLTGENRENYADIEKEYNRELEEFIRAHPKSDHVADAMLLLALSAEFNGDTDQASDWYGKISTQFPDNPIAKKAAGARMRLNSEGKSIRFSGKTVQGEQWDLDRQRGKVVLIQFWATWCEPCKDDLATIRRMHDKYSDDGLVVASVSVDEDVNELAAYLRNNQLPWVQLYGPGGLEGPLAEQLGIVTLPTMLLVGEDGKVISRNITSGELDREIQTAVR